MATSQNLGLPLIEASQAQKHVTHNEALRALDAIVQLAVKDRDLATPPGAPADGDRYLVAASPTDDWTGHAGEVAAWQDGVWDFYTPQAGWRSFVEDEGALLFFDGAAWDGIGSGLSEIRTSRCSGLARRPTRPTRFRRSSTRRCGRQSMRRTAATATCDTQ